MVFWVFVALSCYVGLVVAFFLAVSNYHNNKSTIDDRPTVTSSTGAACLGPKVFNSRRSDKLVRRSLVLYPGDFVTAGNGQVVSNLDIEGDLVIEHPVEVFNVRVRGHILLEAGC